MKQVLSTPSMAPPSAPYSLAVEAQGLVFVAGQVGVDPVSGALTSEDIGDQTRRCLENLGLILKDVGLGFSDVVKTGIYLTDFADFATVNDVYRGFFPIDPPARATVAVRSLAPGFKIEIEAIAAR
jgi:2-iminobutanoate/2-iminopropanoate deaminase